MNYNNMKRTYIIPDFTIMNLCESEMIAGAGSVNISKGNVNDNQDIGFVKENTIQESESGNFWE